MAHVITFNFAREETMSTIQKPITTLFVLSLLVAFVLLLSHEQVEAAPGALAASPASHFTAWEQWSDPVSSAQFDISKCGPDSAHNSAIQIGDFNGDGRPDLLCRLAVAGGGSKPYVQLAGADSYSAWAAWRTNTVEPACSFDLVADLNGDGLDDWLCAVLWQGRYETFYFRSNGSGFTSVGYMIASVAASALDLNRCQAWFVADVNGDGREDVLCHYLYPDLTSRTLAAMDDGDFTHHWDAVSPLAAASSFRLDICGDLDSGDVDGNGELDWICFYEYPDGHTATFVQLAQGGSYSGWRRWSPSAMAGAFQRSRCHYFHVVDVDGDGLADRLCMYQNGAESGILVQTDGPATTGLQFGDWESWFVWSGDVLKCRGFDGAVPEVIDVNGD
ncbi:MAG: VCBS repeat-containing protein, partial [Anaerolineales bacterium]|nr:VCBS repeat-containing protein [Anaerolineales bacterium]